MFWDIEMPLVFTLFDMEQAGVRIEAEELKKYGEQLGERSYSWSPGFMRWQESSLISILQNSWVLILFEKLQMPHAKKTKTGYSTAADVLEKLAPEFPIVDKILEYRKQAEIFVYKRMASGKETVGTRNV